MKDSKIRCYGGPLHGEHINVEPGVSRIYALDHRRKISLRNLYSNPAMMMEPNWEKATYEITWWHERAGNAHRRMRISILEGAKLLPHEHYGIEKALSKVPWEPVRQVSILKEFERWWSWCVYRHAGRENHLHTEFQCL